ncbi:mechanosensitive ion channel protein MscS, partial [Erwinia amylovora]|nr:mechanosensitive ion channel protein MscS [Erwinia amylovora]
MDNLYLVDGINYAGGWVVRIKALLLVYLVNIFEAIVIVFVGMIEAS